MTTPTASEGAGNPDTLLMGVWDGTATRTQFGRFFENLSVQPPFNPATALIPEKWKLQEALGQTGSGRGERTGVSRVRLHRSHSRAVISQGVTPGGNRVKGTPALSVCFLTTVCEVGLVGRHR